MTGRRVPGPDTSGAKVAVVGSAISATEGLEITEVATLAEGEELVRDGTVEAVIVADSSSPVGLEVVALDNALDGVLQLLSQVPAVRLLETNATNPGLLYLVAFGFGIVFFMSAIIVRLDHHPERCGGEADPRGRAAALGRARPGAAGRQDRGQQHPRVRADRADRGRRRRRDARHRPAGARHPARPRSGWFVVFFAIGFVLLASMFAATAALVSRMEDAGTVTTPVTMLVMLPYFLVIFFNNNDLVLTVMSYVPFSAPVAMPLRSSRAMPWWWSRWSRSRS